MQLLNQKNALEYRSEGHPGNERKARTRTLIQLGGLIEKSGLLPLFDLQTGDDLQKDPETFEGAATLFGALLSLKEEIQLEDADACKTLWNIRGKENLAKE